MTNTKNLFSYIGIFCLGVSLLSCNDDGVVGDSLLGNDKVAVLYAENEINEIYTVNNKDANLNETNVALLGTFNDPEFGQTKSSAAFHLRLTGPIQFRNAKADSAKLYLYYSSHYGDSMAMQTARVFQLNQPISFTENYTQEFDISPLLGAEVGSQRFNKKSIKDSIFLKSVVDITADSLDANGNKVLDSLINHLVVNIDKDLVQEILDAPASSLESGEAFVDYFKGLYLNTDALTEEGAVYSFDWFNSSLRIYYQNQGIDVDTFYNASFGFPITDNSARINFPYFENGSGDFANAFDDQTTTHETLYLKGVSGSKVTFNIDGINNWQDSTNVIVNKALIRFKVDSDSLTLAQYPAPSQLLLAAIDEEGEEQFISFPGLNIGVFNSSDSSYVFPIPYYLQNIIGLDRNNDGDLNDSQDLQQITNYGFNLYIAGERNTPKRVVIRNKGEDKPKLEVTYTRLQ